MLPGGLLVRVLHGAARLIIKPGDHGRCVRASQSRLIHRIRVSKVEAKIIDGKFRGLGGAALSERGLDLLANGWAARTRQRRLLDRRPLALAAELAVGRGHLPGGAGGSFEESGVEKCVTVRDVGSRFAG